MPRLTGVACAEIRSGRRFRGAALYRHGAHSGHDRCCRGLRELPLPYDEVAEIGAKIAAALDDLHRQHVIHLDVKPSNIMFRPTRRSRADRLRTVASRPAARSDARGIPACRSARRPICRPSNCSASATIRAAIMFALGVLLYFFSTGVRPFGESETMRGMRRRLWRDPVPPRRINGRTIRPGCRRSSCAASRSSRHGAIRRRRSSRSILGHPTRSS